MEQWTEDLIQWDFTPVPPRAQTLLITCHPYLLRLGVSVPIVLCANSMMAQIRPSVLADVSNLLPYCIRLQQSQLNAAFNRKHGRDARGKDKEKIKFFGRRSSEISLSKQAVNPKYRQAILKLFLVLLLCTNKLSRNLCCNSNRNTFGMLGFTMPLAPAANGVIAGKSRRTLTKITKCYPKVHYTLGRFLCEIYLEDFSLKLRF